MCKILAVIKNIRNIFHDKDGKKSNRNRIKPCFLTNYPRTSISHENLKCA